MYGFTFSGFADEAGKSLEEQIAAMKRNALHGFEPRGIDGKNISDFSVDEAKTLKSRLDAEGLRVTSIGSHYGKIEITDPFEEHFEKFKNTVEVAKILDCSFIRMFSFYFTKGESFDEYRDEVLRRVKAMADYSYEHGVFCCLENEKEIYGDNAERNLDVLRNCGGEEGKLFAILDPANYIQCGVQPMKAYDLVDKYIKYLHVKDALFENGQVVPAGCGDGKVAEIIARFAKRDGEKLLSLEPHLTVFDGLNALEAKGETEKAMEEGKKYTYSSNAEAFDAAVTALKAIVRRLNGMKATNESLCGKVAVITGGGGVLCSGFAEDLAGQGCKVAVLDLNEEASKKVTDKINQIGGTAMAVGCNVLEQADLEKAREKVNAVFGTCDVLLNGAGGNSPKGTTSNEVMTLEDMENKAEGFKTFFDLDAAGIQFVFNLNFLGTLLTTQAFAKDMIGKENACILNVSSMNAYRPLTKIPAYSAAKAAVQNFTQFMAVHFAKVGIRVNAIAPGFFSTNQNKTLLFNEDGSLTPRSDKIISHTPMGRFGVPADLTGALLFLCDGAVSGFVTGIIIPVDGGFSAYSGV